MLSSLGILFEPVERRGEEFAVRLTAGFFALPSELRETVLGLIMAGAHEQHSACHELVLYDQRDGRRIGTISEDSGLQLARRG